MALDFRQAMKSIHMRAEEVSRLADRGDPLALKVMNYYRLAWNEFHGVKMNEARMAPVTKTNLISSATEYLVRDMTLADLTDLRSKFDHRTGKKSLDISKLN